MWLKVKTSIIWPDCICYCEGHVQCLLKHRAYDLSISPLALKCANDILCTRLLTLSPLAKVWMVISLLALTCDSTSTHARTRAHTRTSQSGHTKYWLGWFVTSFPPLLPSHSYWFLLVLSYNSPSFSPSSCSSSLHPLSGFTPTLFYLLFFGSPIFYVFLSGRLSFAPSAMLRFQLLTTSKILKRGQLASVSVTPDMEQG